MASCPNCGRKLKLTDLSQYCPGCGVNMRFVNFEENFIREAKYAELSQAGVRCRFRRFKGAFIGSKLTIARLACSVLPALTLLIPAGSYALNMPFIDKKVDLGVFGLMTLFTEGDLGYILGMTGSDYVGAGFTALRSALFAYLGAAFFAVAVLLASLLCFISIKKMQKVIAGISVAGALVCAAAMVFIGIFAKKTEGAAIVSGSFGFGLIVTIIVFAAVAAVNLILDKKGVTVAYDEGMVERAELFRELKAGKIRIDDLPQPVIETSATRELEKKIAGDAGGKEAEDDG
ncbi:MAG: hypothetical protein K6C36_08155 [Clostridia bacterium]|nr:hypothetical protein [Clostridia bacterium]